MTEYETMDTQNLAAYVHRLITQWVLDKDTDEKFSHSHCTGPSSQFYWKQVEE